MDSKLAGDPLLRNLETIDGCKLLSPCLLYEKIGEGGCGAVYRAQHLRLENEVAVKCLLLRAGRAGQNAVSRFEREARLAAAIDHPNLVRVTDVGETEGLNYLIMEFVPGETARARVARLGPLAVAEATAIAKAAAEALRAAHVQGVVHRDVKPDNILVARDGRVKLADLGIAKATEAEVEGLATMDHVAMGTPGYMPPEQWEDAAAVGPAADVYALGATLFFLLTGHEPLGKGRVPELRRRALEIDCLDPRTHRPDLPEALGELVMRATAKLSADRFPDMGSLLESLAPFLGDVDLADEMAGQGSAEGSGRGVPPSYRTLLVARQRSTQETVRTPSQASPARVEPSRPSSATPTIEVSRAAPPKPRVARRPAPNRRSRWVALGAGVFLLPFAVLAWHTTRSGEVSGEGPEDDKQAIAIDDEDESSRESLDTETPVHQVQESKKARLLEIQTANDEFKDALERVDLARADRALTRLESFKDSGIDMKSLRAKRAEVGEALRQAEQLAEALRGASPEEASADAREPMTRARELCTVSPVLSERAGLDAALAEAERGWKEQGNRVEELLRDQEAQLAAEPTIAELAAGLIQLRSAKSAAIAHQMDERRRSQEEQTARRLATSARELPRTDGVEALLAALIELDHVVVQMGDEDPPTEVSAAASSLAAGIVDALPKASHESVQAVVRDVVRWEALAQRAVFADEREKLGDALDKRIGAGLDELAPEGDVAQLAHLNQLLTIDGAALEDDQAQSATIARIMNRARPHLEAVEGRVRAVENVRGAIELCDELHKGLGNEGPFQARLDESCAKVIAGLLEDAGEDPIRAVFRDLRYLEEWRERSTSEERQRAVDAWCRAWAQSAEARALLEIQEATKVLQGGAFSSARDRFHDLENGLPDGHGMKVLAATCAADCTMKEAQRSNTETSYNKARLAYESARMMEGDYRTPDGASAKVRAAKGEIAVTKILIKIETREPRRDELKRNIQEAEKTIREFSR